MERKVAEPSREQDLREQPLTIRGRELALAARLLKYFAFAPSVPPTWSHTRVESATKKIGVEPRDLAHPEWRNYMANVGLLNRLFKTNEELECTFNLGPGFLYSFSDPAVKVFRAFASGEITEEMLKEPVPITM